MNSSDLVNICALVILAITNLLMGQVFELFRPTVGQAPKIIPIQPVTQLHTPAIQSPQIPQTQQLSVNTQLSQTPPLLGSPQIPVVPKTPLIPTTEAIPPIPELPELPTNLPDISETPSDIPDNPDIADSDDIAETSLPTTPSDILDIPDLSSSYVPEFPSPPTEPSLEDIDDKDVCLCNPLIKNPVCGSDNITYDSLCFLNHERVHRKPWLTKAYNGECKAVSICFCPFIYAPVCSSIGNTYGNICQLNCDKINNPGLYCLHKGPCQKYTCKCTREYNPVCGSDGTTYGNHCFFGEACNENPFLREMYRGRCRGPRVCSNRVAQMCGSDLKTYRNACVFGYATELESRLRCIAEKSCNAFLKGSGCPRHHQPVCASNGGMYWNIYVFRMVQEIDPSLRLVPCTAPTIFYNEWRSHTYGPE